MAIGAGVAAQGDFPLVYKSVLPTLLVGTAVVRYLQWRSRSKRKTTFETGASIFAWCHYNGDHDQRVCEPLAASA